MLHCTIIRGARCPCTTAHTNAVSGQMAAWQAECAEEQTRLDSMRRELPDAAAQLQLLQAQARDVRSSLAWLGQQLQDMQQQQVETAVRMVVAQAG